MLHSFVFTSASKGVLTPEGKPVHEMRDPLLKSFIKFFIHPVTKKVAWHGKILARDAEEAQAVYRQLLIENPVPTIEELEDETHGHNDPEGEEMYGEFVTLFQ